VNKHGDSIYLKLLSAKPHQLFPVPLTRDIAFLNISKYIVPMLIF